MPRARLPAILIEQNLAHMHVGEHCKVLPVPEDRLDEGSPRVAPRSVTDGVLQQRNARLRRAVVVDCGVPRGVGSRDERICDR